MSAYGMVATDQSHGFKQTLWTSLKWEAILGNISRKYVVKVSTISTCLLLGVCTFYLPVKYYETFDVKRSYKKSKKILKIIIFAEIGDGILGKGKTDLFMV